MKALVKHSLTPAGVSLMEIDKPIPKCDELLVKIQATGICGTDIHIMDDEFACNMPVVLGHEFTGIVEEIGNKVSNFKIGDQVIAVTATRTCESCEYCRAGLRMLCNQRKSIGSGVNGAMAEYMVIPSKLAYKVPDNLKGSQAIAIAEPVACVVRAVIEQSKIKAGDIVLVSGPGTMGLLTLQIAKFAGAFVIVSGTSIDKERLALAEKLGADITCSDSSRLGELVHEVAPDGVNVAYECAGAAQSFNTCLELVKKRGNLSQVGLYGTPISVDMDKVLFKEVETTVSFASEPTSWDIMIKILSNGNLQIEPLISDVYMLEDWKTAFDKFRNKAGFKILLTP